MTSFWIYRRTPIALGGYGRYSHEKLPGTREDKTIESAVPFPAPEKGDNRGLSPFHPRMIIVVGECPLLSPV